MCVALFLRRLPQSCDEAAGDVPCIETCGSRAAIQRAVEGREAASSVRPVWAKLGCRLQDAALTAAFYGGTLPLQRG